MNEQDEKAAFKVWRKDFVKNDDGFGPTAYEAWLARAALAQPVYMTDEGIKALYDDVYAEQWAKSGNAISAITSTIVPFARAILAKREGE